MRAWTVRKGATAPQAAGVIHTDFERGFIRAEVIAFADYFAGKGEAGAKREREVAARGQGVSGPRGRCDALPLQRVRASIVSVAVHLDAYFALYFAVYDK